MVNSTNQENLESAKGGSEENNAQLTYKLLLQVRDLDNNLLWTRVNVMLLVQGILFSFIASGFSSLIGKYAVIVIIAEFFGLISAFFLWLMTLGGSYWVTFWEKKLEKIENKVTADNFKIFRGREKKERLKGETYISTRKAMKVFSSFFIVIWVGLIGCTFLVVNGVL